MLEEPANQEGIPLNRVEAKTRSGNAKTLPMTAWLDVLRAALPPTGVLLVGAGAGEGPWVQWLQSRGVACDAVPVHLVEGDEQQYRHLQGASAGCTLWRDVVATSGGAVTFHCASNPAESGLLPVQSLQKLWPHLAAGQDTAIEDATTLDALHAEAGGRINWLVLDCLPAVALLYGGEQLLPQLDVALVRVANDLAPELLANQQAVDQLLQAAGLRCIHIQAERHPALAHVLYVRDMAHQLNVEPRTLQGKLQQAQSQAKRALEQAEKSAGQLKQAQEAWAKEKAELAQAHQVANESARQPTGQELQEQLLQAQANQWEACQQSLKDVEKQLRTSLDKGLANSVKQIEDFISIQNYLSSGEGLSNFHGWPISPDIGLFLVELIREHRYDLIIEFGSGTSTALFARALKINRPDALPKAVRTSNAGKAVKSPSVQAVRPVCTFEHDKLYLHKTQAMLETQGLLEWVALNHAPLVDWQDNSGQYLYYDCDATLAALAKQFGSQSKRVLVLVDGPPGTTCANARYPAVPHVFKHFARHEVDVVLDDANRPEEKSVIELWRAYWKKRSIRMNETIMPSEKGLYWAFNY